MLEKWKSKFGPMGGYNAVSYTHLDVYKRQLYNNNPWFKGIDNIAQVLAHSNLQKGLQRNISQGYKQIY